MKQNLKIKKTTFPREQLSYNDWCKEFKVSSRYTNKKFYDMYYSVQAETNLFKHLIRKYNEKV